MHSFADNQDQENAMQRFKNILVFAGTGDPAAAIKRAFEIGAENRAVVTLMDVVKPLPSAIGIMTDATSPDEIERLLIEDRRRKLVELANQFSRENLAVEIFVSCGDAAQEVTKRVLAAGHDLVVKTADGLSTSGQLFGSTARSLMRICPCPVWVLKPQVHGEFDQVLAAVDIDADDETHINLNVHLLELANAIAKRDNAQLHVVSVWDLWMEHALRRRAGDEEINAALAQHEAKVRSKLQKLLGDCVGEIGEIKIHLHRGKASTNILNVAEEVEADLIVMGTVCRTGVAGFLIGNTAENLLSDLTCSVLAVKPQGFASPVEISSDDASAQAQSLPMI
jgi:nucleotide-binding universal stress UspA family protein